MQTTVNMNQGFGVVGEVVFEGPLRAQPGTVKGATAANIVVGRAFTIDSADGKFQPGGTGAFGGILANPKSLATSGPSTGALDPTLVVPANTEAQFVTMGEILVYLTNAAAIGAGVYFVQADGTLGAGTAGAGQTQIANAAVKRYANAAAGLAVISLTGA